MKEITSVNNELIKETSKLKQRKYRNESGLFIVEGLKGVLDAIEFGINIKQIFIEKDSEIDLSPFDNELLYMVTKPVLKKISTTDSPPEILAIAAQKHYSLKDTLKGMPLLAVLDGIKDPGNLGTIIRTATACGVTGIILTDDSVDLYNPKTVRSSVGNLWKMPVVYMDKKNLKKGLAQIPNCQFLATVVKEDKSEKLFYDINYQQPTVILFGSEAKGLSQELISIADEAITIPMTNDVESLNLSISAGVILYEAARQRAFK